MNFQASLEQSAVLQRIQKLIEDRLFLDARAALEDFLKHNKNDARALWMYAELAWREHKHEEAINRLRAFIKLYPQYPNARLALADYLTQRGRFKEATSILKRMLREYPGNRSVLRGLAHTYEMRGDEDEARKLLAPYIEARSDDPEMARIYANLEMQEKRFESAIEVLGRHIEDPRLPDLMTRKMWYLIGKAHEKLDHVDKSFVAYYNANQINPTDYDADAATDKVERTIQTFSKEQYDALPVSSFDTKLPVFVLSRPRSGSTLLERIIGSHPLAHAAGELQVMPAIMRNLSFRIGSTLEYPECVTDLEPGDLDDVAGEYFQIMSNLEPGVKRVTDKNIGNHRHLGAISRAFPNARFIDLRRAPLDNCLACFTIDLGNHFPASFDLEHLATEYRLYVRIMEHWHSILDAPILRVNYEDLVADQETWSRRIIDFIGLPWDDQCLRFYETGRTQKQQMTAAPTLSYNQVTKPIYKSSVNRAERFGKHLGRVRELLEIPDGEHPLGHDMRF